MADTPLIEVERTPNPEALRILPGIQLASGAPIELRAGEDTSGIPLAAALLAIEGVASILVGSNFVTIVRSSPDYPWSGLKPQAVSAVADFALSGEPLIVPERNPRGSPDLDEDEITSHIREVIERFVRPLVARDGGEASLIQFDPKRGIAYVRMGGACGGCPSSTMTLKRGIEQIIKRYVPEVVSVQAVAEGHEASADPKARFRSWIAARMRRA